MKNKSYWRGGLAIIALTGLLLTQACSSTSLVIALEGVSLALNSVATVQPQWQPYALAVSQGVSACAIEVKSGDAASVQATKCIVDLTIALPAGMIPGNIQPIISAVQSFVTSLETLLTKPHAARSLKLVLRPMPLSLVDEHRLTDILVREAAHQAVLRGK